MAKDLFLMVMEAEGDLVEPFDGGTDAPPDAGDSPEQAPSTPDGMDAPPPLNDTGDDALAAPFDDGGDSGGQDDNNMDEMGNDDNGDDQTDDTNANDTKLSDKANAVLNQKLYQQMVDRNQEISDVLENLSKITPVLPYEVVQQNETPTIRLRQALQKGQDYLLDKFLGSKYGENLMFFHKLDALYTVLLQNIDENLKKFSENDKQS